MSGAKIDVIHAQCVCWGGMAARQLKKKYGIPYVITEHSSAFIRGTLRNRDKAAIKLAYRSSGFIIAVSGALKRAISPYVGRKAVSIIPNCVDSRSFRLREGRSDGEYRLVSVAGLTKNKAFDVLIAAFTVVCAEYKDIRLSIAGDGPEKYSLERQVIDAGIKDRVEFLGALDRVAVAKLLSSSDAFVSSSRHETFGVVLVEAMMSGLPVVATRCGGPEEIVSVEFGLLVKVGDVAGMSTAIRQVRERHCAGEFEPMAIREYAMQRFDSREIAVQLERVLAESCSEQVHV